MLAAVASLILLGGLSAPQNVDFNDQVGSVDPGVQRSIQTAIENDCTKFDLVGATVVVAVDGRLVAAVGVGKRKFGSPEPLLVTDPMQIGSNTKGMTALVFSRLVEQGKLKFRETVKDVVPFFPSEDFANLPLIEFLDQRSGISDASAPKIFESKYLPGPEEDYLHGPPSLYFQARQTYLEDCLIGDAGYAPESKFSYCNSNYIVAGAIEEQVSGKTWEELIQSEVFGPLHMGTAGFSAMGTGTDVSVPWQHTKENGVWKPIYWDNPRFMGPAGLVHCSALDLANYSYAQAVGAAGKGNYLSARTWKTLQTPPTGGSYACGMISGPADKNGVRNMAHDGSNNLSYSTWHVFDHGRIVIVAMTNCPSGEGVQAMVNDASSIAQSTMAAARITRSPSR